jgi:redox-sensitive bicupin YhaK (pirin superfamily)
VLYGARVAAGASVESPVNAHVHVFAALGGGSLTVDGHEVELAEGDAARLTDPDSIRFTAGADGAEILVWVTA